MIGVNFSEKNILFVVSVTLSLNSAWAMQPGQSTSSQTWAFLTQMRTALSSAVQRVVHGQPQAAAVQIANDDNVPFELLEDPNHVPAPPAHAPAPVAEVGAPVPLPHPTRTQAPRATPSAALLSRAQAFSGAQAQTAQPAAPSAPVGRLRTESHAFLNAPVSGQPASALPISTGGAAAPTPSIQERMQALHAADKMGARDREAQAAVAAERKAFRQAAEARHAANEAAERRHQRWARKNPELARAAEERAAAERAARIPTEAEIDKTKIGDYKNPDLERDIAAFLRTGDSASIGASVRAPEIDVRDLHIVRTTLRNRDPLNTGADRFSIDLHAIREEISARIVEMTEQVDAELEQDLES